MRVHHYETAGGKDLIEEYLAKLSKAEEVDGTTVFRRLVYAI